MGSKPVQHGPHSKPEQKAHIINYMYAHRGFAHGKFGGLQGSDGLKRQWERLVAEVNAIEGGIEKTVLQWQRTWADTKKRARAKATALILHRNSTGHFPKGKILDILDRKVLSVMGQAAVEGIPGSRDSMPESEAALRRLMAGDRTVVNADEPISLFEAYGIGTDPIDDPMREKNGGLGERSQHTVKTVEEIRPTKREAQSMTAGTSKRMAMGGMMFQSAAMLEKKKEEIETMNQIQMAVQEECRMGETQRKLRVECLDIISEFEDIVEWMDILD